MECKWRFPASGHGERKGISSGDIEAFKKHPFRAFAREILQNSIDARNFGLTNKIMSKSITTYQPCWNNHLLLV